MRRWPFHLTCIQSLPLSQPGLCILKEEIRLLKKKTITETITIVLDFYGLTCLWDTVIFSGIIPGFAEGDLSLPEDSHLFAVGCPLISHGSLFILTQ